MKFRKKPVVVEATQWFKNGDHPLDYSQTHDGFENGQLRQFTPEERKANEWEGDIVRYYRHPGVPGERTCTHCGRTMHDHGWIETLEGGHNVCPGDWIITGVAGEMCPCKPDIFAATYEPATQREPVGYVDPEVLPLLGNGFKCLLMIAHPTEQRSMPLYTDLQPAEQSDVTQLVEALEQIERWDGFPSTDKTWEDSGEPVSYGAAFGSNGERDFMREVARKALAAYGQAESKQKEN